MMRLSELLSFKGKALIYFLFISVSAIYFFTSKQIEVTGANELRETITRETVLSQDFFQKIPELEKIENKKYLPECSYSLKEEPLDYYVVPWADIELTTEDFDLICHTVFCEAGNQSLEAQKLVSTVIINRVASDLFPNTVSEVVYQGYGQQFNVVNWNGFPEAYTYTDQVEEAVFLSIATYPDAPRDMLFFRSGHYFSEYENYTSDGDMYFSLRR